MTGVTSPDNIPYLETSDGVYSSAFSQAQAEAIQDALDGRAIHTFRWADAVERGAQIGMVDGDKGYQIDTGLEYIYANGSWRLNTSGLVLLDSRNYAGTSGTVSFDNVFSSAFTSYRIVGRTVHSANGEIAMRLRAGGVDETGAVYNSQVFYSRHTGSSSGASAGLLRWPISPYSDINLHTWALDLFNPANALTITTGVMIGGGSASSFGTANAYQGYRYISTGNSNAYDGCTVYMSTAGTAIAPSFVNIYGYVDNF